MEKHLAGSDWFTGPAYGIPDIALFAYTDVADDGGFDLSAYPAIRGWLARVRATPGLVAMTEPAADVAALLARPDVMRRSGLRPRRPGRSGTAMTQPSAA